MRASWFQAVSLLQAWITLITTLPLAGAQQSLGAMRDQQDNQAYTTASGYAEYRIGAGDELRVRVWTGLEVREFEVTVQADGTIFLPFVGLAAVEVGGLSALQVREHIVELLRVPYREPAAEVVVKTRVARTATLLGEIQSTTRSGTGAGRYPLPGRVQLVDFVTDHGGLTPRADFNNTQLIRNGTVTVFNLSRAIFQGDLSQNPVLDDGDLIYVPSLSTTSRKFLVFGEVGRPGLLELQFEAPIAEVVARAGGFTISAHKSHVVVVRGDLASPTVVAADFEALAQGDVSQNVMLQDGDMIFVARKKLATFRDVMSTFAVPLSMVLTTLVIAQTLEQ